MDTTSSLFMVLVWISLALGVVAFVLALWLTIRFRALRAKQNEIFEGKSETVEDVLLNHSRQLRTMKAEFERLSAYSQETRGMSEPSIQKVGLVRFNPFGDTGGDQSFAIALLDVHNNGFVISSLHGRGGTRMYAKKVDKGTSAHHLSEDEKKALAQALGTK